MTARCTTCSNKAVFRAYKGSKMSDQQCKCGGKYELLSCEGNMRAEGLVLPDGILPYNAAGDLFIYPWKNRVGDLFLINYELAKFIPFKP